MDPARKRARGELETQFRRWAELSNKQLYSIGEFSQEMGISLESERQLLTRLTRRGVIHRATRGVYLIPRKPTSLPWRPSRSEILEVLTDGQYQLCGLEMFNYYGLSEQISNVTYAYNTKISGTRKIGSQRFSLIKVPAWRLGQSTRIPDKEGKLCIPTLGRCIFDAIYDYSRFGTLPRAFTWIKEKKSDRTFLKDLVLSAMESGNVSSRRRIGYVLESVLGPRSQFVKEMQKMLPKTTAVIPLNPNAPTRGEISRKWGIVDNE